MKCIVCGQEINNGVPFCQFCGAKQPVQQQAQPQQPYAQSPQQVQPQVTQPQQVQPQVTQPQARPVQQQAQPQQPYAQSPRQVQPQVTQPQPVQPQATQPQPQQPYAQAPQPQAQPVQPQPQAPQPEYQWGQQPPAKSNKKPIIISIIISAAILVIAALLIIFLVVIPKNRDKDTQIEETTHERDEDDEDEDEDEDDDEDTEEDTEEVASSNDADTEEATEATTEEPAPVSYAEENGVEFTTLGTEFTATAYLSLTDDNDNEVDSFEGLENLGTYYTVRTDKVLVSEPDENGNVRYLVEIYSGYDMQLKDSGNNSGDATANFWIPNLYDYYTGYEFLYPDHTEGLVDKTDEVQETTLEINGKNVTVTRASLNDYVLNDEINTVDEQDGVKNYHFADYYKYIYVIYAPADYDGLMIAMNRFDITKERYEAESAQDKSANKGVRLFDKNAAGYQNTKDDVVCIRLSEVAEKEDAAKIAEMYSAENDSCDYNFDWKEDAVSGNLPNNTETITDSAMITGWWKCMYWWDRENKMDCYGEELTDVYIEVDGNRMTWKDSYVEVKWGTDGEWEEMDEEETTEGVIQDDGSVVLGSEGTFKINGFYTDGYSQYAIGTITVQSGESADILLVRP